MKADPATPDASNNRVVNVKRGSVLFQPGQACSGFVIVHDGTIKVSLVGESGREIILYRVRPGEVCLQTFGCLVNGVNYSAEGQAETNLDIEIVPPGEFQRLVVQDQTFRQQLFSAVAARFFDLERLVENVALSPIDTRLARALLALADDKGLVAATHEKLATEIGSVREVVSRQLNGFARDGVVEIARGQIKVLSRDRLQAIASLNR